MWRDLLSLSRREQLAFIGLIVILFAVLGLFFVKQPDVEREVDKELDDWASAVQVKEAVERKPKIDTVFKFDPNTERVKRLQLLGFSNLAIVNLIKYREAGGYIKSPEKLKQVYGVDSMLYEKLQNYIDLDVKPLKQNVRQAYVFADNRSKNKFTAVDKKKKEEVSAPKMKIEINTADTAMFALLKGIGPVLSRRIISYRKRIGGFYLIQQLGEVYGLSQEVIDYNLPFLEVDDSYIQPMDISSASLKKMKSHPYLDYYMAKEIYEARRNNSLVNISQFYKSKTFLKTDTAKLNRYFVVGKEARGEN
jgi:DNA uptake protein ComE-like DNA-binding protein